MAEQRKFRLSEDVHPMVREGVYQFKVGFDMEQDGVLVKMNYRDCPVITVKEGDVVATTNAWAAQTLEAQVLPNRTFRNGENRGEDNTMLWAEVDVSIEHDHDLDPILDGAIAALTAEKEATQ